MTFIVNPFAVAPPPLPTLSFQETLESTADQTAYTFSGANLGTAGATRSIIVQAGMLNEASTARTVSTLTVGGVSATFLVRVQSSNSTKRMTTEFWIADVPTGTTGDVVVTWSGGAHSCKIGIWAAYDLNDSTTAVDTASHAAASAVLSVNTLQDGIVVAGANSDVLGSTSTCASSWVGVTERYDDATAASNFYAQAGADVSGLGSDETPRTVTVTISGLGGPGGCAISMR